MAKGPTFEDFKSVMLAKRVKQMIRDMLKSTDPGPSEDDEIRDISSKIADRVYFSLWPERLMEVKRDRARLEVEQRALADYISSEVRTAIEESQVGESS